MWRFEPAFNSSALYKFNVCPDATTATLEIVIREGTAGAGGDLVVIYFADDGKIKAYQGAVLTELASYSADTWYDIWIQLDFVSNQYRIMINQGAWSSMENLYNNVSAATAGTLAFRAGFDASIGTWFIDRAELASLSGYVSPMATNPIAIVTGLK